MVLMISECRILRVMRDSRYIPGSDLGHCFCCQQLCHCLDHPTSDQTGVHVDAPGGHIGAGCDSRYAGSILGICRLVPVLYTDQHQYGRFRSKKFDGSV